MVTGPLLRDKGWGSGRRDWPSCEEAELCLLPQSLWQEQCPWQGDPGPANEAVIKLQSSPHTFEQGVFVFRTSAVLGMVTGMSNSLVSCGDELVSFIQGSFVSGSSVRGLHSSLGAFCCPGLSQQCHLVLPGDQGESFLLCSVPALLGTVLSSARVWYVTHVGCMWCVFKVLGTFWTQNFYPACEIQFSHVHAGALLFTCSSNSLCRTGQQQVLVLTLGGMVAAIIRPFQHAHSLFWKGSLNKSGFMNSLHADCWLGFLDLGLEERCF